MANPSSNSNSIDPFDRSFAMAARSASLDSTADASAENTENPTPAGRRERKKVGFSGAQSEPVTPVSGSSTPARQGSLDPLLASPDYRSHLPQLSRQDTEQIKRAFSRPRPVLRSSQSTAPGDPQHNVESDDEDGVKAYRRRKAREALQRGIDLERDERVQSAPVSRQSSPPRRKKRKPPKLSLDNTSTEAVWEGDADEVSPRSSAPPSPYSQHIFDLDRAELDGLRSGAVTPVSQQQFYEDYQPRPKRYRRGVLGHLLRLGEDYSSSHRNPFRSRPSRTSSGVLSRGEHYNPHNDPVVIQSFGYGLNATTSTTDIPTITPAQSLPSTPTLSGASTPRLSLPSLPSFGEQPILQGLKDRVRKHGRLKDKEYRIKKHIDEILQRQNFLIKLCRALMMYGAPSHRLEEYMKMGARVLEIQVQVLYIPGAMLLSFDDPSTHTTELRLVKAPQAIDLGKLQDVHAIYKDVLHDQVGVKDAKDRLNAIFDTPTKHSRPVVVLMYGLASVCVGPFAFSARFIDLPICFLLGAIVGFLQLYVAVQSDLYSSIFEVLAAIVTSFLARAFGSIRGGELFCFSALAQSAIALILPGYIVLLASLELISKNIVAGSVRMVYAIIYSLFLGYGITLGTAIYGLINREAVSDIVCEASTDPWWYFLFVPGFTMCLLIINQAKWKQAPMMLIISGVGYVANYFITDWFHNSKQVGTMFGALAIGLLANTYSRLGPKLDSLSANIWEDWFEARWRKFRERRTITPKSLESGEKPDTPPPSSHNRQARRLGYTLAAAAMLPAIFVQVPSGLSVGGSLLTGVASANQLTSGNTTMNATTVSNVTSTSAASEQLNTVAFNVAYSVVQIAIGITVGLFVAAICVYPLGKKRSGLFSF